MHHIEVSLKLALLLQIPAPKCTGTAHPYRPIGLPLLKLVKSINKFKKNGSKKSKIPLKTSLGTFHILKKTWKSQASSFYFKKLNKVHHGTTYK